MAFKIYTLLVGLIAFGSVAAGAALPETNIRKIRLSGPHSFGSTEADHL
jgi:hypothetical protein